MEREMFVGDSISLFRMRCSQDSEQALPIFRSEVQQNGAIKLEEVRLSGANPSAEEITAALRRVKDAMKLGTTGASRSYRGF